MVARLAVLRGTFLHPRGYFLLPVEMAVKRTLRGHLDFYTSS